MYNKVIYCHLELRKAEPRTALSIFQAIIMGIVQGVTEFVPISSSAHLIIVPWLLHWNDPGLEFDVTLHLGTLVALLWFFLGDWLRLVRAGVNSIIERKIGYDLDRRLAWLIIIGTIPGVIAGALGESKIEEIFHQPGASHSAEAMAIMAILIAILGVALYWAERNAQHVRELGKLSLKDVIVIGFSQALAILPGVSRSGSTITAGLALGLQRQAAARFSFLLATPIVAGAGFMSLFKVYNELQTGTMIRSDLLVFAVGFISAAISGYFCIRILLRFLEKNSTDIFVYYRLILAAVIIGLIFIQV